MIKKNITSSPQKYQILKYQKKYLTSIEKLFLTSFNKKRPKKFFEYRQNKTPYGKQIIYLMKYQNQIVGYYSIYPFFLKIKNRSYLGGYSHMTMTHPNHRNKGIFLSLAKKTYEEAEKQSYNFIFTFANANSYSGFIRKLGFKELKPVNFIKTTCSFFYRLSLCR